MSSPVGFPGGLTRTMMVIPEVATKQPKGIERAEACASVSLNTSSCYDAASGTSASPLLWGLCRKGCGYLRGVRVSPLGGIGCSMDCIQRIRQRTSASSRPTTASRGGRHCGNRDPVRRAHVDIRLCGRSCGCCVGHGRLRRAFPNAGAQIRGGSSRVSWWQRYCLEKSRGALRPGGFAVLGGFLLSGEEGRMICRGEICDNKKSRA